MTQREADERLDFEALRLGIEGCEPDLVLGFYAEEAELTIVNASDPQSSAFELRGKVEIAKHLRAVFDQETSHRIEGETVDVERVTFREVCEYLDGVRVQVRTTLEVRGGKIFRQVDLVERNARAGSEVESDRITHPRIPQAATHAKADAPPLDQLRHSDQATRKEDLG